jgi:hypothetical protein
MVALKEGILLTLQLFEMVTREGHGRAEFAGLSMTGQGW